MRANPFESVSNPFENDIIREPREVSFSISGLNDAALAVLTSKFSLLDARAPPREPLGIPLHAQLVVSPDRGYGKSHLLGRLFSALKGRAATIYLKPFQDPSKAWQSILRATLQELALSADLRPCALEGLAVGVLAHLGADCIGDNRPDDDLDAPQAVEFLRQLASDNASPDAHKRAWIEWLTHPDTIRDLVPYFRRRITNWNFDLDGRERAWLNVLATIARAERSGENWSAAVKWLRAEQLETNEVSGLGLDKADNDGQADSSPQEIDALSFRRLQGLCTIAAFRQPFVFCFDQTEFFVGEHALIGAFGRCVQKLVDDVRHQMTVITANQSNWLDDISPYVNPSNRDRINRNIVTLRGVQRDGARELAAVRLRKCGLDDDAIAAFFANSWLDEIFETLPEYSVRDVLMRASERFRMLANQPPPPPITFEALFEAEVVAVRQRKPSYDPDTLIWFAKDIGPGLEGVSVARATGRYFSLQWTCSDLHVYFAFEGRDSHKTWKAMAKEALELADRGSKREFSAWAFRTPDLTRVPRDTWMDARPALDAARERGFRVFELTFDQVCEVHAARELYSNALQGNIAYGGPETLAWLRTRFLPFLKELAVRSNPPNSMARTASCPHEPPKPKPKVDHGQETFGSTGLATTLGSEAERVVLELVREQRIVDISVVLGRLGGAELRDPVLRFAATHPNLKAHAGPATTHLQWRIAP